MVRGVSTVPEDLAGWIQGHGWSVETTSEAGNWGPCRGRTMVGGTYLGLVGPYPVSSGRTVWSRLVGPYLVWLDPVCLFWSDLVCATSVRATGQPMSARISVRRRSRHTINISPPAQLVGFLPGVATIVVERGMVGSDHCSSTMWRELICWSLARRFGFWSEMSGI